MKKLASGLAALLLAGALAIPAPASAHSLSFGFGFNVGPRVSYCDLYPWDCRPLYRPRARISVDVGPLSFGISTPRLRTHVARCKARFQSYVLATDSYFGFDGDWHRCRL